MELIAAKEDPTTLVTAAQHRELKAVIAYNDSSPGANRRVGRADTLRMLRSMGWRGTETSLEVYCRTTFGRQGFVKP